MPLPHPRRRAVRAIAATALLAACRAGSAPAAPAPSLGGAAPDTAALRRDVAYLAGDALAGRATGTPGNDSAAVWIARRFAALALAPAVRPEDDGARRQAFMQPFTARSASALLATQNVVALLPGTDSTLRAQYVIVGAHFDHLGRSAAGALDPAAGDAIRNGADDNASGTAVVLELARLMARRPARRSIVFAAFSGEELGVLGSQHFVEHSPVPLDSVQAMLNFDMVGRMRDSRLTVYGVGTAAELPSIVSWANGDIGLRITGMADGFGPSDHASFAARGVPVLHFFTDLHDDYHRATDDADRVDAGGMGRVVALAEQTVRALADRPERLTVVQPGAFSRAAGARATGTRATGARAGSASSAAYLGTVPDMRASDTPGIRLAGVRPGGPADRAGLRAGDVVVELGGRPVTDLQSYADALRAHRPGDAVDVVVLRAGERRTARVALGTR